MNVVAILSNAGAPNLEVRESVMAQKMLVQFVDDLDGTSSEDVSTVQFGLDGVSYEIDLNAVNAERLRDALASSTWRVVAVLVDESNGEATLPARRPGREKPVRFGNGHWRTGTNCPVEDASPRT